MELKEIDKSWTRVNFRKRRVRVDLILSLHRNLAVGYAIAMMQSDIRSAELWLAISFGTHQYRNTPLIRCVNKLFVVV